MDEDEQLNSIMDLMDVHSYSRPEQVRLRHLDLDLTVHFNRKTLEGAAALHFDRIAGDELILDTRGLEIHGVDNAAGFTLGDPHPFLGTPLRIRLNGPGPVRVRYATSPGASGLQWLEPAQTAGKAHPFLYTQSQAIHARSWLPVQDSPGVRVTYTARVTVPPGLRGVMGAASQPDGSFRMDQPVPSYLIALAVGDLARREIGPRSAVYAEPPMIDAAAREFEDTEAMIRAVEELYGP
jgi:leukotriene-A4 hydrolase